MNNNSAWTGKHLAYAPAAESARSWKGVTRRLIACGTGALMCASLLTPSAAFAAEIVTVGDTKYAATDYVDGVGDEAKTWWWDGKDDLSLNNYNGGAISARGDLNVSYSGTNTVTGEDTGILVYGEEDDETASLTVSGSEGSSLTVNASDREVAEHGVIDSSDGIYCDGDVTIKGQGALTVNSETYGITSAGDLTLDNANVNVNVTAAEDSQSDSIAGVEGYGNVTIKNGTTLKVNVVASNDKQYAAGVEALFAVMGDVPQASSGGNITISDSDVDVKATGESSCGIYALNQEGGVATISINHSRVHASGSLAAIMAAGFVDGGLEGSGVITIDGANIVSPEGGVVYSFSQKYSDELEVVGQAIGLKGATSPYDASDDVLIEPVKDEEPEETVTPASAKTSGSAATRLAQTGDASAAGMFAAVAAGATALGAGAFLSRRRG